MFFLNMSESCCGTMFHLVLCSYLWINIYNPKSFAFTVHLLVQLVQNIIFDNSSCQCKNFLLTKIKQISCDGIFLLYIHRGSSFNFCWNFGTFMKNWAFPQKCWQRSASLLWHGWKFSAGPGNKVRTNGVVPARKHMNATESMSWLL